MKNEDWINLAICALLSVLGGQGRLLSTKSKKPITLAEMGRNAVVSLSIGAGVFLLVRALIPASQENAMLLFAAGYFAGWAGPWLVNALIDKFANEKGLEKGNIKK